MYANQNEGRESAQFEPISTRYLGSSVNNAPHDKLDAIQSLLHALRQVIGNSSLNELGLPKANRKAIRLPDVKELTGDSRSQIYARLNPKSPAYSEIYPRPFYVGRSPRWWQHEVIAWLEIHAASRKH